MPAAAHDHPRRCRDRPRHRVHLVPQRAAARVGARDGRAHRRRRGPHGSTRRRPVRRLPELLRLARLRHPAADPARAGARGTSRSGTSGSTTSTCCPATVARVVADAAYDGERVDAVDGVVFAPGEAYLTLARFTDDPSRAATAPTRGRRRRPRTTPATEPFFRSLQRLRTDRLTMHDYLWRWDTDWFWCSGAFGLHDPRVRRLWPRRWRRSDVYHRIVGLENRFGVKARLDRRRGLPERERVIQDVEVPVERLAEFLTWFDAEVGMRPVWLCPLRSTREWPSYPLRPGATYVNVGLLGHRPDRARHRATVTTTGRSSEGDRARRAQVALLRRLLRRGHLRPALRPGLRPDRPQADRPRRAADRPLRRKWWDDDDQHVKDATGRTAGHHRRGARRG